MFAMNLAATLFELSQTSDVSPTSRDEMLERFEALRNYGKLPRSREKREQSLTNAEVVAAILGLASTNPKWAGHIAIVLGGLRTAGGKDASFFGTDTLQEAVERILTDPAARKTLLRLAVSGAESGTNSHGQAVLVYEAEGATRRAFFVPKEAVSRLRPGAEREFDEEFRNSHLSRETSYSRAFFDRVVRAIEVSKVLPAPVHGDGSEYDAEEARQARYRKLGAGPASRFLNIGVDNQVTWPQEETVVKFDRYQFVLMPKTENHVQSIHVDPTANKLSGREARTVINRFLSIMTWCDDQFANAQDGWSGNPVPVAVPRRDLAFTTTHNWIFDRKIPADEKVRRALALYREARNAQQNFMVSYAVLNFYKIVEIGHRGRGDVKGWFRDNFALLKQQPIYRTEFEKFAAICDGIHPHEYIYDACRIADAHAGKDSKSDPDDTNELLRLHTAADVLKILARHFIASELRVWDSVCSGE